jgi:hypothetical protein
MIYAIRAVGTDYIKFGYSTKGDASDRVAEMQTGCPFELMAIAWCEGDRVDEHRIHMRLKLVGAHARGEWFVSCPETDKVIWELRERAKSSPARRTHRFVPVLTKTGTRLGRVLEYARTIPKHKARKHSVIDAAPASDSLQPDKVLTSEG